MTASLQPFPPGDSLQLVELNAVLIAARTVVSTAIRSRIPPGQIPELIEAALRDLAVFNADLAVSSSPALATFLVRPRRMMTRPAAMPPVCHYRHNQAL